MNEENVSQSNASDSTGLLDDFLLENQYQEASLGQRFLNFVIDNLLMRYGLSYLTATVVGAIFGYLFPDYIMRIVNEQNSSDLVFFSYALAYAIAIFNYLFYYTICEKAFKGYTLGKLITGTRALREDGAELSLKDAFLRTLSRLVPFEVFSAFGVRPWHDQWTKTVVIKSR